MPDMDFLIPIDLLACNPTHSINYIAMKYKFTGFSSLDISKTDLDKKKTNFISGISKQFYI